MSQNQDKNEVKKTSQLPKLVIKQKNPEAMFTGANTIVELDGKELKGITFLKIEVKGGRVGKVLLELVANVEMAEATLGHLEVREHNSRKPQA